MNPTELDELPPMSAVVTDQGLVWQKGYTRWFTPGVSAPADSVTLSEFGKLQIVWEGEA